MIEALLVMMNNYFHDLAVAFLFASCLLAHVVVREWPGVPDPCAGPPLPAGARAAEARCGW